MSEFYMEPKEASRAEMIFGPRNIGEWLPAWEDIPDEFKPGSWSSVNGKKSYGPDVSDRAAKFLNFVSDAFFLGLSELELDPKDGIDPNKAWWHVRTCMSSWDPRHEHKEAGCAFLLSLWFDDVRWTPRPPRNREEIRGN